MRDFNIVSGDTDSIMFCKKDGSEFSLEERGDIVNEINRLMPELIRIEDDGYYPKVLVVKTKNYVLFDGKKFKTKGSSLKATMKEPALRRFIDEIIHSLMAQDGKTVDIYNSYAKEIMNLKSMQDWSSKKTVTKSVLEPKRTNESRVLDAINSAGLHVDEGDKIRVFFRTEKELCLEQAFDGTYCVKTLLKKLYRSIEIFSTVLDMKQFLNYSLKRNMGKLYEDRKQQMDLKPNGRVLSRVSL